MSVEYKETAPIVIMTDCDGVMVKSEPLHRFKLIYEAQKFDVHLDESHFKEKQLFLVPTKDSKDWEMTERPLHGAGDKAIYYWLLQQRPELSPPDLPARPELKGEIVSSPDQTLTMKDWTEQLLKTYQANADRLEPVKETVALTSKYREMDRTANALPHRS